jgi:hypothetical protein
MFKIIIITLPFDSVHSILLRKHRELEHELRKFYSKGVYKKVATNLPCSHQILFLNIPTTVRIYVWYMLVLSIYLTCGTLMTYVYNWSWVLEVAFCFCSCYENEVVTCLVKTKEIIGGKHLVWQLERKTPFERLRHRWKKILKWILTIGWTIGLIFLSSGYRLVVTSFEHGNEPSGYL